MALCPACRRSREHLVDLTRMPWERLLSRYEFMIVFASFRRNMCFYSAMNLGQLRTMYSQIVSFSPARMLVADALISSYKKLHREGEEPARDPSRRSELSSPGPPSSPSIPWVPCPLSEVAALALGNRVPRRFVHESISEQTWRGYDEMVFATLASIEVVRGGALKYLALVRSSARNLGALHTITALAVVGWQRRLDDGAEPCTCGAWPHALEMISCFVPDAETSLSLQDETRVSAYVRTLFDITEEPVSHLCREAASREDPDYHYAFRGLLVADLDHADVANDH